jgi:hypothetical protein
MSMIGCSAPSAASDAGDGWITDPPGPYTYVIGAFHTDTGDPQTAFGFDLDPGTTPTAGTCTDSPDFVDPSTRRTRRSTTRFRPFFR